MNKRGRSLSSLSSGTTGDLEAQLMRLSFPEETKGQSVIERAVLPHVLPGVDTKLELITREITVRNRTIAQAARRQVVSDTLRVNVVAEHDFRAHSDEALYDFALDFDDRSLGLVVRASTPDAAMSSATVGARQESQSNPPENRGIDLSFSAYEDAFSTEDLYSNLPTTSSGLIDSTRAVSLIKTIPWFDEFTETVTVKGDEVFSRVQNLLRSSFSRTKSFYARLAERVALLFQFEWPQTVLERKAVLTRNFPRGILGFRALSRPTDPRNIKALVVKQVDKGHAQMIILSKRNAAGLAGQDEDGDVPVTGVNGNNGNGDNMLLHALGASSGSVESRHATIPDMKRVWCVSPTVPRVRWFNTNSLIPNMAEMENNREFAPWSLGEIRIFLERIGVYGRNFKRIAVNLPDKSERDCVEFYYRFKIHLNMKAIIGAGTISRQARQLNATGGAVPGGSYRDIVDEVMTGLENELGGGEIVYSHKQLEQWTIERMARIGAGGTTGGVTVVGGDESPKRERKEALIDVLTNVIVRGHAIPPQLSALIESAATTPATTPLPMLVPVEDRHQQRPRAVLSVVSKPALSVVKTDITTFAPVALLPTQPSPSLQTRQLQSHNTV